MASPLLTGRTLVNDAMLLIGAIASGETGTGAELSDGLRRLNELIDNWSLQALTALVNERHVLTVTANVGTYYLGPTSSTGGSWVVNARPDMLTNAGLLLNSSTPAIEIDRGILTDDEYAALTIKDLTSSLFTAVYYSPTSQDGTVILWPIPTTGDNDLVLYYDSILAQFADLTTQYRLPAGYAKALRYNLAVDLAPEFGRQLDPLIERTAAISLRQVKAANVKMSELGVDPVLSGDQRRGYNVYSDGYN